MGIVCSIICVRSPKYFQFVALRNDTFFDDDKKQPSPFEWTIKANVGLYKYELLELYEIERTEDSPTIISSPANNRPTTLPPQRPSNIVDGVTTTQTPSSTPSFAPTGRLGLPYNPNLYPLNEVMEYDYGRQQFEDIDGAFQKAQTSAVIAPIMASLGVVFGLIELICCLYVCSWAPTAIFLYVAFMLQTITLFLFVSDNFWYVKVVCMACVCVCVSRLLFCGNPNSSSCYVRIERSLYPCLNISILRARLFPITFVYTNSTYAQDCKLGFGGVMSAIAVVCYMIASFLVCCTPRPRYSLLDLNLCKKPPIRKKKHPPTKKQPQNQDNGNDEEDNDEELGNGGNNDSSSNTNYNEDSKSGREDQTYRTPSTRKAGNRENERSPNKMKKNQVVGGGGGGGGSRKNITNSPSKGKKRPVGGQQKR